MAIEERKGKNGIHFRAIVRDRGRKLTRTFERKRDAEDWESKVLFLKANNESLPKEETKGRTTMKDLYAFWLKKYANVYQAPGTVIREKYMADKYILPHFGEIDIKRITRSEIQDFLATLLDKSEMKPITINKVRQLLCKMFNKALEFEFVKENPVKFTKRFAEDDAYSTNFNYLSKDEVRKVLEYLKEENPFVHDITFTLVSTGMRMGECLSLRISDLNFNALVPHISVSRTTCRVTNEIRNTTKGKRSRIVPMGENLKKVLLERTKGRNPDALVFFESDQEAISSIRRLQRGFRTALQRTGIKSIRIHDLRHTFATQFLENGGNIYSLSKILGHSNTRITEKYSHFSEALKESAKFVMNF